MKKTKFSAARFGLTLIAAASLAPGMVLAQATTYKLRVPVAGMSVVNTSVSLAEATLPLAKINRAYTPFDFETLLTIENASNPDPSQVVWSTSGALPSGMTLTDGVLSGTPTALTSDSGMDFTVIAT